MARQVKVITAAEAAALIKNGDVGMSAAASGRGPLVPAGSATITWKPPSSTVHGV